MRAELVSVSGLLRAAEGDEGVDRSVLVDPDGSGFDATGDVDGGIHVIRPDGGSEALARRVRTADGVVDVGIADDGDRRAELLFVDQSGAVVDVGDDGGAIEERSELGGRFAARDDACAARSGVLDEARERGKADRRRRGVLVGFDLGWGQR